MKGTMRCMICNKGDVVETEEENHETEVAGMKIVIPVAIVGRCDNCKAVNYAFDKEALERGTLKGENHAKN